MHNIRRRDSHAVCLAGWQTWFSGDTHSRHYVMLWWGRGGGVESEWVRRLSALMDRESLYSLVYGALKSSLHMYDLFRTYLSPALQRARMQHDNTRNLWRKKFILRTQEYIFRNFISNSYVNIVGVRRVQGYTSINSVHCGNNIGFARWQHDMQVESLWFKDNLVTTAIGQCMHYRARRWQRVVPVILWIGLTTIHCVWKKCNH